MDKRRIQQFKTRLEIRKHELRVTIEHQLKNARIVEPEPDAVDQANSGRYIAHLGATVSTEKCPRGS